MTVTLLRSAAERATNRLLPFASVAMCALSLFPLLAWHMAARALYPR